MAESSNWKNMLKSQHADLEKLEAMNAELNNDRITADIDKALKKTKISSYSSNSSNSTRRSQVMDNG